MFESAGCSDPARASGAKLTEAPPPASPPPASSLRTRPQQPGPAPAVRCKVSPTGGAGPGAVPSLGSLRPAARAAGCAGSRRAPQAAMAAGAGARPAPRWVKALGEPLSAAQLRRLEEHRYSAVGESLLEPPLQLYWTWLLQWIPLWMAPNTITLIGLAINLVTTLVLIFYCPTVTEEVGLAARRYCSLEPLGGAGRPREGGADATRPLSLGVHFQPPRGLLETVTPLPQSCDHSELSWKGLSRSLRSPVFPLHPWGLGTTSPYFAHWGLNTHIHLHAGRTCGRVG